MATEALTRGAWPRLQWGPVITGVLCALATQIVLGLFGVAFGFAAIPAGKGLGILAAIWTVILVPIVASFIGGWVAVRVASAYDEAGAYLHGALVWCIALIAGAVFVSGSLMAGEVAAGTAASGNVPTANLLRRSNTPGERARAAGTTEDAAKGAAAGTGGAAVGALLGLAAALAGAGVGRRMLTGEGFSRRRGAARPGRPARDGGYAEETGVAYGERGTLTTNPPEQRTDDPTLHH